MTKRAEPVVDSQGAIVGYYVRCPACDAEDVGHGHLFAVRMGDGSPGWDFDGNLERPTFSPSMLARCKLGPEQRPHACHSFVRDGRIEYLSDCTHAMAGQTVELPLLDE